MFLQEIWDMNHNRQSEQNPNSTILQHMGFSMKATIINTTLAYFHVLESIWVARKSCKADDPPADDQEFTVAG